MRIESQILSSVVFFFKSEQDAKTGENPVGTGFYVFTQHTEWPHGGSGRGIHVYMVTNEHIVRASAPLFFIRTTGTSWEPGESLSLSESDWFRHPGGDDIAVCHLGHMADWERRFLSSESLVTKLQSDHGWGYLGDDCFMIGCFPPHSGSDSNLPVARFGNISMLPSEPVYLEEIDHDQECYLVEMRSRGGFSGSPVFLAPSEESTERKLYFPKAILGICCGHLFEPREVKWKNADGTETKGKIKENSGMAMVIPAWKIYELLHNGDVVDARKKTEAAQDVKRKRSRATLDSNEESSGPGPAAQRLEISGDWKDAVKRALKQPPPAKP